MNDGRIILQQQRLYVGLFRLVLRPDQRWALPGGGSANYADLVAFTRRLAWSRPELVLVRVKYRVEVEGEFLAPNTTTSMANKRQP